MKNGPFIIFILINLASGCTHPSSNSSEWKWVYDYANILSEDQEGILESRIESFEYGITNEIAIVTTDSIVGFNSVAEYAHAFLDKHRIGKKGKDNGLVILYNHSNGEVYIAAGYETKMALNEEICKNIIDSTILPYIKEGDYFGGLRTGLEDCIIRWEQ